MPESIAAMMSEANELGDSSLIGDEAFDFPAYEAYNSQDLHLVIDIPDSVEETPPPALRNGTPPCVFGILHHGPSDSIVLVASGRDDLSRRHL
jgi:hypothetical protein